jgi:hypothetical protein
MHCSTGGGGSICSIPMRVDLPLSTLPVVVGCWVGVSECEGECGSWCEIGSVSMGGSLGQSDVIV